MIRGQDTIEVKEMLRRAGKRVTPQRVLILEALREAGGHLDANRIYRLVRPKMPPEPLHRLSHPRDAQGGGADRGAPSG